MKTRKLLVFSTAALMVASSAIAFTACGDSCEHNYSWAETTPATCTAGGVETGTCDKCGEKTTRNTDALGHAWVWTLEEAPTQTDGGSLSAVCSRDADHAVETLEIPALGSASYTVVDEQAATFTKPQSTTYSYTDSAYGAIRFTVYGAKLEITNVEDAIDAALDGAEFAGKTLNEKESYAWARTASGVILKEEGLKQKNTSSMYEFGENYTHIDEGQNVHDYLFYVNGELVIVQDFDGDRQFLSAEYNGDLVNGTGYNGFAVGPYLPQDCYGVENYLFAIYDYAYENYGDTLVSETEKDGDVTVYSFTYCDYSETGHDQYNGDGEPTGKYVFYENLSVYSVAFKLDENCMLTDLTMRKDEYSYSYLGESDTDNSAHDEDACPIEHGDSVTGKDVEHEYSILTVTQVSKLSEDYEAPEKPAFLDEMVIDEFDLWILEEVDKETFDAETESDTQKKYEVETVGVEYDWEKDDYVEVVATTYYLAKPVTDDTIEATTASALMFMVDTKGKDEYLALNSFGAYYDGKDYTNWLNWGDFLVTGISSNSASIIRNTFSVRSRQLVEEVELEFKLGMASLTVNIDFKAGAPEALNPVFSQYNEFTNTYTWNSTASSATVYADAELQLKAEAVVTDDYKLDDSFTAKVTSDNAADAQLVWNEEDEVYTFTSSVAGTYEVTFTSKVSDRATTVLTVVVQAAPDMDELLSGDYINTSGTVKVTFEDNTVTIDDEILGVTTYTFAYADGEIVLSDKSGAGDYSIEINDVYSLVLVSGETRYVLVAGLEPQMVLAGTTWVTSYDMYGFGASNFYIRFVDDSKLVAYKSNIESGEEYSYTLTQDPSAEGRYTITFSGEGLGYNIVWTEVSNSGSYIEFNGVAVTKVVIHSVDMMDIDFDADYSPVTPETALTGSVWQGQNGESTYIITFKADGKLETYDSDPEFADDVEYYSYTLTEGADGRYEIVFSEEAGANGESHWCGIIPGEKGGYLVWDAETCTVTALVTVRYGSPITYTFLMNA